MAPRYEVDDSSCDLSIATPGSDVAEQAGLPQGGYGLVIGNPDATAFVVAAADPEELREFALRVLLAATGVDQVDPKEDSKALRTLHVHALARHVESLNCTNPAFGPPTAVCHTKKCRAKLTPAQLLLPELRGHCPECAQRKGFPIMPTF